MSKWRIEDINLRLLNVEAFDTNERLNANGALRLYWDSDIGWGEYELIFNEGGKVDFVDYKDSNYYFKINGYSEHTDSNDHKVFIKELLKQMIDKINIID